MTTVELAIDAPRVDLRLGFVSDRSCFIGTDGVWVNPGVGRLCEALSHRCAGLTAALSAAPHRQPAHEELLPLRPEQLLSMPFVESLATGFFQTTAARRGMRELESRSDIVVVQLPFAAIGALAQPRTPRVYHVCANVRTIVAASDRYRGLRRIAAETLARVIDRRQRRLISAPGSRLVANGRELLDRYGADRGQAVVSSTLLPEEVASVRRERPTDAPWRILFVGFLRHEKGIDVLLDAFERLLIDCPGMELEIVGAADLHDHGVDAQLRSAVERIGRRATIRLLGHVPFGPELFRRYAEADVCVVPSRSEGTPRVLVEARAFGCPVIASRVGGIPTSIDEGRDGLMVPPGDATALHAALLRLRNDRKLRDSLIAAGYERAHATTVDRLADAITAEARRAYEQGQPTSSEAAVRRPTAEV